MILYHGSNVNIAEINLGMSKTNKDFGCGFYLSPDKAQAEAMADFKVLTQGGDAHVTQFEFDDKCLTNAALRVKTFDDYTEEWAMFVLENRKNNSRRQAHDYDIVHGPIADDKVGPQIRRFENGDIGMGELLNRLKYMRGITFQYFFGTEKAIKYLKRI